ESGRTGQLRMGGTADGADQARPCRRYGLAARKALGVLRQAEFPLVPAGHHRRRSGAGGVDRRRAAWPCEAAASAIIRGADTGGAMDVEPRRIPTTGAFQ